MANQQDIFAQTIVGMKKAVARTDDASDSENDLVRPTNRGNKLKRKAGFVQEGNLNLADGPHVYRKKVDFNGYSRYIISRNLPRIDFDGDVIEDEEDSLGEEASADEDPYGEIKLENLLMPLQSAASLHSHPSLSQPYTSKVLDEMLDNVQSMVQKEKAMLWRMKQLLNSFQGDHTWKSTGGFESEQDILLIARPNEEHSTSHPTEDSTESTIDADTVMPDKGSWEKPQLTSRLEITAESSKDQLSSERIQAEPTEPGSSISNEGHHLPFPTQENQFDLADNSQQNGDRPRIGAIDISDPTQQDGTADGPHTVTLGEEHGPAEVNEHVQTSEDAMGPNAHVGHAGHAKLKDTQNPYTLTNAAADREDMVMQEDSIEKDEDAQTSQSEERHSHRMTTRAKAHAAEEDSTTRPSSPADSVPSIHPFFLAPSLSLPSTTGGLDSTVALETRRLLCAYIQRQEQVCREAEELQNGLMRAKRLRDQVLEWSVQEGHVGEMSDGEDWYDKDKWGLGEEGLRKGEDVGDDDDITATAREGKTRRNRRAAA